MVICKKVVQAYSITVIVKNIKTNETLNGHILNQFGWYTNLYKQR